uniref:Uncharacterized protein n=1 Tax=Zea mays TaxID=4577 RepID=B6UCW7_MAIZE|nr:hypothetical protein [Zea mays]
MCDLLPYWYFVVRTLSTGSIGACLLSLSVGGSRTAFACQRVVSCN